MPGDWTILDLPIPLLTLGLTLLVAVRLMHGDPWSPPREAVMSWLLIAARGCLWTAALVGLTLIFAGAPTSLPFMLIGLVYLINAVVVWRVRTKNLLLHLLSLASQRGLPLPRAVAALANDGRGRFHRRMMLLSERLAAGLSLSEAWRERRLRELVPGIAPVTALVGQQTGRMGRALGQLAQSTDETSQGRAGAISALVYGLGILFFSALVQTFMVVKIAPTLAKLIQEFDVDANAGWSLWFLAGLNSRPLYVALGALTIVCGWLYLAVVLRGLATAFPSWNFFDRQHSSPHSGTILQLLALPVEARLPLLPVVQTLAAEFPGHRARRRLVAAERTMLQGAPPLEALRAARLATDKEFALLAAAERTGNLAWAMRQAAQLRDRRRDARLQIVTQSAIAAGLVLMAVPVVLFALATFGPLFFMVERLALP